MSILFAYISKGNIPTRDSWQDSIDEMSVGVRLELSTEFEPLLDGRACKCTLEAAETRQEEFYLYNGTVEWPEESDRIKFRKLAGNRDYHFMFKGLGTVGSNLSICIACQALVECFGAVISNDGLEYSANSSLPETIGTLLSEYNA